MNDFTDTENSIVAASPRRELQTASADAIVQRTLGEVQVAVMMAKRFPRNKIEAKEKLITDCCRESLAKVSMYSYARGGTNITGPSIRLAEAAKNAWGNMQSGWREISRTTVQGVGVSEIETFAWMQKITRAQASPSPCGIGATPSRAVMLSRRNATSMNCAPTRRPAVSVLAS